MRESAKGKGALDSGEGQKMMTASEEWFDAWGKRRCCSVGLFMPVKCVRWSWCRMGGRVKDKERINTLETLKASVALE